MDLSVIENDPKEVKKYLQNFVPINYYKVLDDAYLYQIRAVLLHSVSHAELYNPVYAGLINDLTVTSGKNYATINTKLEIIVDNFSALATKTETLEVEAANANASIIEIQQATAEQNKAQASVNQRLEASLDDIVVGGRNIMKNSDFSKGYRAWQEASITKHNHFIGTMHKISSTGIVGSLMGIFPLAKYQNMAMVEGTEYSISFYAYGSILLMDEIYLTSASEAPIKLPSVVISTDLSERRHITFKAPTGGGGLGLIFGATATSEDDWFSISRIKVELGNKPSDWTPAPEDVEGYINEVQSSIDTFKDVQVERNLATAQTIEQLDTRVKGNAASILEEKNTRVDQFSALSQVNTELLSKTNENEAAIKTVDLTFTDRYNANVSRLGVLEADNSLGKGKIENLESVTTSLGEVVVTQGSSLNAKINNLTMGGRNLLRNSDFKLGVDTWGTSAISYAKSIVGNLTTVTNTGTTTNYFGLTPVNVFKTVTLIKDKEYVLSFYAKGNIPSINDIWITTEGELPQQIDSVAITDGISDRYSIVFIADHTTEVGSIIIGASGYAKGKWFAVAAVKLEIGNKATDWTEAPEDTKAFIHDVEANINEFKEVQVKYNEAKALQLLELTTKTDNNIAELTELREITSNVEGSTAALETKLRSEYVSAISTTKSDITKDTDDKIDLVKQTLTEMSTDISSKADITRVDSVENDAKQSLATAKTEITSSYTSAISTVRTDSATDATNKANKAKTDANIYTDGKVTTLTKLVNSKADISRVDEVENNANKSLASTKTEITSEYTSAISTSKGQSATDAQNKADKALEDANSNTVIKANEAQEAAEVYALAKAKSEADAALALAKGDATSKSDAAKSAAIAAAALDAKNKADKALADAKLDATAKAEAAKLYAKGLVDTLTTVVNSKADITRVDKVVNDSTQALAQAKTDIKGAYTLAITESSNLSATDAQTKANKALADATIKATQAQTAAETYALAQANAKAAAALDSAKTDATTKANKAKADAELAAALDAKNKADEALRLAKLDATAKADAVKDMVESLTKVVESKASISRVDTIENTATQALATAKTELIGSFNQSITETVTNSEEYARLQAEEALKQAKLDATTKASNAIVKSKEDLLVAIDGIEIGGRNYFQYIYLSDNSNWGTGSYKTQKNPIKLEPNGTYTLHIKKVDLTTGWGVVNLQTGEENSRVSIVRSLYNNSGNPRIYENVTQVFTVDETGNLWFSVYGHNITTYWTEAQIFKGTVLQDWSPAPEDLQSESVRLADEAQQAAQTFATAQAEAERVKAEAYADGIVSAEEQARIAEVDAKYKAALLDATQKSDAAKNAAILSAATDAKTKADNALSSAKTEAARLSNLALDAAKVHANTKAEAERVLAEAHADGIVSIEEEERIKQANAIAEAAKLDATNKADAAKNAAVIAAAADADSKVSQAVLNANTEAVRLSNEALAAAKVHANAQAAAERLTAEAHADSIVTAEEQARIAQALQIVKDAEADATSKSAAAQAAAIKAAALDATAKANKALLDAKADSKLKADAARDAAKLYAETQADAKRVLAEAYADGIVTAEEEARILDVNAKLELAKADAKVKADAAKAAAEKYARDQDTALLAQAKTDAENKAKAAEVAAKEFTTAQNALQLIEANAYADGVVDAEEKARIQEAIDNLAAAKLEAKNKADEALASAKTYAVQEAAKALSDAKLDATDKANAAKLSAEEFATSEAEAKRVLAQAYADGIVTAEEERAIKDANDKLAQAKADAQTKADKAKQAAVDLAALDATAKADKAKKDAEAAAKTFTTTEVTKANSRIDTLSTSINDAKQSLVEQGNTITSNFTSTTTLVESTKKELDEKIDGIEIGGRNYVLNSQTTSSGSTRLRRVVSNDILKLAGKEIVISADVRSDVTTSGTVYIMQLPSSYVTERVTFKNITSEWERHSVVLPVNDNIASLTDLSVTFATGTDVEVKNWKVEQGNKATDWTPAPEDTTDYVDKGLADAKTTSEQYAAQKANEALTAANNNTATKASEAQTAAETYALAKAKAEADAALVLAKSDATTKANAAKSAAEATAALDAKNKADKALADAKLDATAKADAAKTYADGIVKSLKTEVDSKATIEQLNTVKNDANQALASTKTELTGSYTTAIATAKSQSATDAQTRATKALTDAKADTVLKANAARTAAETYALAEAKAKADAALVTAKSDATTKANAAESAAKSAAALDAKNKADASLAAAKVDATTKANAAITHANSIVNSLTSVVNSKASIDQLNTVKNDATQALASTKTELTSNYTTAINQININNTNYMPSEFLNNPENWIKGSYYKANIVVDLEPNTTYTIRIGELLPYDGHGVFNILDGTDSVRRILRAVFNINANKILREDINTTFTTPESGKITFDIYYFGYLNPDYFKRVQINKGTTKQDWIPSIIDAELKTIANTTAISSEATARSNADTALTNLITTLDTDYKGNKTAIRNELTAVSNKTNSTATSLGTLTTTVGGNTTKISQESTARSTADTALGTRITTLDTDYKGNKTTVSNSLTSLTNADTALGTRITTLDTDYKGNKTAIRTELTAVSNKTNSTATSVGTLTTTVNGHTSSINETKTSLNGISAKWTMETNVNGKVSGIYQHSTGKSSGLDIITDKFTLSNGTTAGYAPFRQEGNITYLNMAVIKDASIATAKIANLAVDTLQIAKHAVTVPVLVYRPNVINIWGGTTAAGTAAPISEYCTVETDVIIPVGGQRGNIIKQSLGEAQFDASSGSVSIACTVENLKYEMRMLSAGNWADTRYGPNEVWMGVAVYAGDEVLREEYVKVSTQQGSPSTLANNGPQSNQVGVWSVTLPPLQFNPTTSGEVKYHVVAWLADINSNYTGTHGSTAAPKYGLTSYPLYINFSVGLSSVQIIGVKR